MKKILVATDASESSRRALTTALDLAQKFNAEVELLFVMHAQVLNTSAVNVKSNMSQEMIQKQGEQTLEAALKGTDISNVNLVKKVIEGKPADIILKEVAKENIDLIVMGSHGYGTIVGSLLGSVSQKVLHGAKCSVLIVK